MFSDSSGVEIVSNFISVECESNKCTDMIIIDNEDILIHTSTVEFNCTGDSNECYPMLDIAYATTVIINVKDSALITLSNISASFVKEFTLNVMDNASFGQNNDPSVKLTEVEMVDIYLSDTAAVHDNTFDMQRAGIIPFFLPNYSFFITFLIFLSLIAGNISIHRSSTSDHSQFYFNDLNISNAVSLSIYDMRMPSTKSSGFIDATYLQKSLFAFCAMNKTSDACAIQGLDLYANYATAEIEIVVDRPVGDLHLFASDLQNTLSIYANALLYNKFIVDAG